MSQMSQGEAWPFPGPDVATAENDVRLTLAILESALDCVIVMDGAGRVLEFNRAAVETFGFSREEALGTELAQLIAAGAAGANIAPGWRGS